MDVSELLPGRTDLGVALGLQRLNCSDLLYNGICEAICMPGWALDTASGSQDLTCQSDGNFTGNATCVQDSVNQIYRCSVQPPGFGLVTVRGDCSGLYHGSDCLLECPQGYNLEGAQKYTCNKGTYSLIGQNPTCQPKSCRGLPFIVRARDLSSCRDLAHGSSCMPTCESGFSYRGSNITCQLGVFDVTGSCFPSQISMKDIENTSAVNFLAVFDPGASIQVYTAVMNYSWAVQNEAIIVLAISQVTGYPPNNITVQIINGAKFSLSSAASAAPRRLSANLSNNTWSLVATVDTGKTQTEDITDKFVSALRGNGSNGSGIFWAMQTMITDRNETIPVGFGVQSMVTLDATSSTSFLFPVIKWLVGEWGVCSTVCGQGTKKRVNNCTSGSIASCTNLQEPAKFAPCEVHSACPFEVMCPLGPPSPACETQQWLVISVLALHGVCCCSCAARWMRIKLRKPKEGSVNVSSLKAKVRYTIDKNDPEPVEAAKVHVIWDLDADQIQTWLNYNPADHVPSALEHAAAGVAPILDDSSDPTMEDSVQPDGVRSDVGAPVATASISGDSAQSAAFAAADTSVAADQVPLEQVLPQSLSQSQEEGYYLSGAKPMYEDGATVEYFSASTNRWIRGIIHTHVRVHSDDDYDISYNVRVCREAVVRRDVSMDSVRLPLEQSELIEVFSKRQGGVWFPAHVSGHQPAGATSIGYTIVVEETTHQPQTRLENIPSVRLRRRFLAGWAVEVYRGPVQGWVSATVRASPPAGGEQAELMSVSLPSLRSGSSGASGKGAADPQEMWKTIPVSLPTPENVASGESDIDWVPTYLLRCPVSAF